MTINVGIITQSTDSFGQWLTKTNLVINALAQYVVSTNSNTAPGNAAITGTFYANSYFVSNAGSLFLSTNSTANAIANSNQLIFNSGPTSNAIITSSGMLIDGSTAYTKTLISMGNTVIRTGNVSTNSAYFTDQLFVGNNFLYKNSVAFNQANIVSANFAANLVVGAADGNTKIDRTGIYISYNDNLPAGDTNSYLTAYELRVGTVKTDNLQLTGSNSVFNANVFFLGANNYFDKGLNTGYATSTFRGNLYSNNLIINSGLDITPSSNWDGHLTIIGNGVRGGISLSSTGMWVGHNSSVGTKDLILSTDETARVFIDGSTGYVGINNTTPPKPLTVSPGKIRLTGSASGYVDLEAAAIAGSTTFTLPTADGSSGQFLATNGSGALSFQTITGSVSQDLTARSIGVGTSASGTAGELRAIGNIIAYYSDERLKEVINPIENALSKVLSLDGFYYKGNDTAKELGYDDEKIQVGLSAQKVQAVLPEAVFPAPVDEKYLTVQYDKLVPLLIEAIKELKAEIDSLKNGNKD